MKVIIFVLAFAFILNGCSKKNNSTSSTGSDTSSQKRPPAPLNAENLLGSWVSDNNMGFVIKLGGKAASINMATLDYNYWKVDGHNLILNSTSKGVSNPVTVDEILIIRELSPKKLIVSPSQNPGTWWIYNKK